MNPRILVILFIPILLLLFACQVNDAALDVSPEPIPASSTALKPDPSLLPPTPTLPATSTIPAASPTQTQLTPIAPTSTPTAAYTPHVEIQPEYSDVTAPFFTLPVGENGVRYRGGAQDSLVGGPNAIAVLKDGTFAISDNENNRILLLDDSGNRLNAIHLGDLGIHILTDMVSVGNDLLVLEVGFGPMPETNHIYRISNTGALVETYTLPTWATMQEGLTGFDKGPSDEIYIWMIGREKLYEIVNSEGEFYPTLVQGFTFHGNSYWTYANYGMAGDIAFETQLTEGLGGLRLLAVNPDGSFFLERTDMVYESVIRVDQTIHYMNNQGEELGVARTPINLAYYYVERSIAVGPDGAVYYLLPRNTHLEILKLMFYQDVPPFLVEAEKPLVKRR
jgi:hypothetical protein